ncbi:hypothetical protein QCA50_003535 [Cerrena zonata]|uniref:F-box domain-containing protein n=1 Tax=Cerrena zonata TaxID=2478898 RepID=A0AAW0GL53_9APHY
MNPIRRNSKILAFLKKSPDSAAPTSLSPAQALDSDVLRRILSHIVVNTHEAALHFHRGFPAFGEKSSLNIISHPHPGQADLLHAIHTCRLWYAAGVRILYARICLVNIKSIGAWAQTIINCPSLASLVKEVYLLDQNHVKTSFLENRRRRKGLQLARTSVVEALRCCLSVDQLVVTNRTCDQTLLIPLEEAFVEGSSMTSSLQRFTVFGYTDVYNEQHIPVIPSYLTLPHLETLCLREVSFYRAHSLPYLPRLRTLQIVQCRQVSLSLQVISSVTLPALETLHIYDSTFPVGGDGLNNLRTLHVLGGEPGIVSCCPRAEIFAFDFDYNNPPSFSMSLNRVLSLTALLPLGDGEDVGEGPRIVGIFVDFIKSLSLDSLTHLIVILDPMWKYTYHPTDYAADLVRDNLQKFARWRDIKVEVIVKGINDWVFAHIQDPF